MKYKIEIKFDFQGLEKDEVRDCKLEMIESDIDTCIESEYPLHIPNKDEILTIGDEDCIITKISHCITKDYYTTTLLVKNSKIRSILNDREMKRQLERIKRESKLYSKMLY